MVKYHTYNELCVAVLLRLGEDRNIQDGKISNYTGGIQGYIKAIPNLLEEAAVALGVIMTAPIFDTSEIMLEEEAYALAVMYIEGVLRKINDEDYGMSTLSEFYQRRDEYIRRHGGLAPRAIIAGGRKI